MSAETVVPPGTDHAAINAADHLAGPHRHESEHSAGSDHHHDREPPRWLSYVPVVGALMHGHSHGEAMADRTLESSARGIRAVKLSLVGLFATAALQLVVVLFSGSAALLADTIHNFADALTALPLWLAYTLGRRPATRRYTYGFGRAEDLAGVLVVVAIVVSALVAGYESWRKLMAPEPVSHLGLVAMAAVIGFLGNEAVALFRIREGEAIGSAALVADGQHARADGLTSLAVLASVGGVALGFPLADPLVGLIITLAILFIARDAALLMWQRLMDAVDPSVGRQIETAAAAVPGVQQADGVRVRWMGHRLQAEVHVRVDEDLTTRRSHAIAEAVRHRLFHELPRLGELMVHVDPCGHGGDDAHADTQHHQAGKAFEVTARTTHAHDQA